MMIAPGHRHGKASFWQEMPQKRAKAPPLDHEDVKSPHNNALFPSIAGHAGLG
jgi:hypothetical protein